MHLASSEALHHIVSLRLCALRVYYVDVEPIVDQLMEQVLGSLLALHKHQHGRGEPLCNEQFD